MADCGASGTVLDRAARSILMNTNNGGGENTKQIISNLFGHATRGGLASNINNNNNNNIGLMPLHAPDEIILLSQQHQQQQQSNQIHNQKVNDDNNNNQIIHQQQHNRTLLINQQHPSQQMPYISTQQHHHVHPQQQRLMVQQQQQMQQQMQQQQQQMMFMQQQQQQQHQMMMMQQQQQQLQYIKQQEHNKLISQQQNNIQQNSIEENNIQQNETYNSDIGHEGSTQNININELSNAWHESLLDDEISTTYGHDGIVNNTNIESLSNAWAEANAEYQSIFEQHDNNIWTGEDTTTNDLNAIDEPASYTFINQLNDETNIEQQQQDINWMDEGIRQFDLGNLKEAIHAFELEIQINNNDNASAWRMLGKCHAENDMDNDAIICLENSIDRDPYNQDTLLALGVSYVNELNHNKALEHLKSWITNNPKFIGIDFNEDVYGNEYDESNNTDDNDNKNTFDEVQRLLLHALEFVSNNNDINMNDDKANILETLGVVYNVSRDYEAAIDSLQKAVLIHPNNYQLWNKLGATLANNNQSNEALIAYYNAIQIKPKYTRVWLNMAISHSNLNNYNEAIRCYLQTISLNPLAIHCWSYLRIALSCLERWDLIQYAASQDLKKFHEYYDFIMYE